MEPDFGSAAPLRSAANPKRLKVGVRSERMKPISQTVLLFVALFIVGCAARYQTYYPSSHEITIVGALYGETRVLTTTNGVQRYLLAPGSKLVGAAESLLQHYSCSEEPEVRRAAATRLAHFGTNSALRRALELARTEGSAEIRAAIWSAIAELLQRPPTWPAPQITHVTGSAVDTNIAQLLSSPDLRVVISCGHRPADFILPADVPLDSIEDAIITQFSQDAGHWSVEVVDRIPFVPFSARHYTATLTVRQAIANTLQWTAHGNERILRSFQEFSRSEDESISGPAKEVVSALSENDALTGLK